MSACEECARLIELLRHERELAEFYKQRDAESRLSIEVFAREAEENIERIDALTEAKDRALVELRLAQDAAKLAVSEYENATRDLEREYQDKKASASKEAKRLRAHLKYLVGCVSGVADKIKYEDSTEDDDE